MPKKQKLKHTQKIAYDLSNLYLNPESILHCEKCKNRLGVLHTLRYALFRKQGASYFVPCKTCGCLNRRVKGAYKQQVNQQWKDFESLEAKYNEPKQRK